MMWFSEKSALTITRFLNYVNLLYDDKYAGWAGPTYFTSGYYFQNIRIHYYSYKNSQKRSVFV